MRTLLTSLLLLALIGCRGTGQQDPATIERPAGGAEPAEDAGDSRVVPAGFSRSTTGGLDILDGTRPIAVVNSVPLFASEVLQRQSAVLIAAREQLPPAQFRIFRERLIRRQLNTFIERKLLVQALLESIKPEQREMIDEQITRLFDSQELPRLLRDHQVDSQIELDRKLADIGLSVAVLKNDFGQQQMAREYLKQKTAQAESPGREQLVAYYNKHADEYRIESRVRWREILVSFDKHGGREGARRAVDTIVEKLRQPADFSQVAREYSDGPTAADGGQWDWTRADSLSNKQVERHLFELPLGTVSRLFEGPSHFQIVQPTEREEKGFVPFAEVQAKIRARLIEESRARMIEQVLKDVKRDAVILTPYDGRSLSPDRTSAGPPTTPLDDKPAERG